MERSPGVVENVIFVTIDGVRTQEVFLGLDKELIEQAGSSIDLDTIAAASGVVEQRELIWPWMWGKFLKQDGVVAGNRFHERRPNTAKVANMHRFSYPGYSEMFTGKAEDEIIASNANVQNPFKTVFEFIKEQLKLHQSEVAVFASWAPISKVAEHKRGSITTNAGQEKYDPADSDHGDVKMSASDRTRIEMLNLLQEKTTIQFEEMRYDSFTAEYAMMHLKTYKPRLLYVGLGETDEWAHHDDYGLYIRTIQLADYFLRELWNFVQSDEKYRGKTALIITADHGRGDSPSEWQSHSRVASGSEYVWVAVGGVPSMTLRGDLSENDINNQHDTIYSAQIASTIARLLGLDWQSEKPDAADPLGFVARYEK